MNINNIEDKIWLKHEEYDYLVWDDLIAAIVAGAEKYSNLNVDEIKKAIDLKQYYYFVSEDENEWFRFFNEIHITEEEKKEAANYKYSDAKFYRSKT